MIWPAVHMTLDVDRVRRRAGAGLDRLAERRGNRRGEHRCDELAARQFAGGRHRVMPDDVASRSDHEHGRARMNAVQSRDTIVGRRDDRQPFAVERQMLQHRLRRGHS